MKHPLILVPASFNSDQSPAKYHFNRAYIARIESAGGFPVGIMRPNEEDIDAIFEHADGLFLMGGNDIDPAEYREGDRHCILCEPERDRVELLLLRKALERKIPILAICRGFQIINVGMGGSLYQDVLKEMPNAIPHSFHHNAQNEVLPRDLLAHEVEIQKDTILYSLAKRERVGVNSLHHQGIKVLGAGLRVSAVAPDGLIEAVEIEGHPFGLGVEWHPEELDDELSQNIFSAFIAAAKNRMHA